MQLVGFSPSLLTSNSLAYFFFTGANGPSFTLLILKIYFCLSSFPLFCSRQNMGSKCRSRNIYRVYSYRKLYCLEMTSTSTAEKLIHNLFWSHFEGFSSMHAISFKCRHVRKTEASVATLNSPYIIETQSVYT